MECSNILVHSSHYFSLLQLPLIPYGSYDTITISYRTVQVPLQTLSKLPGCQHGTNCTGTVPNRDLSSKLDSKDEKYNDGTVERIPNGTVLWYGKFFLSSNSKLNCNSTSTCTSTVQDGTVHCLNVLNLKNSL